MKPALFYITFSPVLPCNIWLRILFLSLGEWTCERKRQKQTERASRSKMDAGGQFCVTEKMGRRRDFPPYLSRQLHFADSYLVWQRGMWGSLHLAFNWLSICQHFSLFPLLKASGRSANIDFTHCRIQSRTPNWVQRLLLLLPGLVVHLKAYTCTPDRQYLQIDLTHNNAVSITGHLVSNL